MLITLLQSGKRQMGGILLCQLFLCDWLMFGRTPEAWSTQSDVSFFAVLKILAVAIDLVGQDGFRVTAIPLSIGFHGLL